MTRAAALILGSFLLFFVQPMVAKALLPWFGGTAAVWTVCLLFFQAVLLAGYGYAHIARPIPHAALAVLSLAALRDAPFLVELPNTAGVILTLAATIGVPYFVLASNSPLVQRWSTLANPYRLYALSNFASLAALLVYPVLIERWLSLRQQMLGWAGAYAVFVLLTVISVWRKPPPPQPAAPLPPASAIGSWILLAACGSALLAAATNQMSQEIAPIPLLWVVPLALYLLSFIVCFDRPHWYDRHTFSLMASIAIPAACVLTVVGANVDVRAHLTLSGVTLFVCLILLHGELASARPEPASLTVYYVAIAAGGALGGAFVALIAPRAFSTYAEYPILLASTAALVLWRRIRAGESIRSAAPLARSSLIGLSAAVVVPFLLLDTGSSQILEQRRSFHGVLRVSEREENGLRRRVLTHGQTTHGLQLLDPARRRTPTAYYGWASAPALAIEEHQRRTTGPLRIGVIGLGTGTLARYGRPGDLIRFYEINPQVIAIARERFTFVADSMANVEISEGDARLALRDESPANFDILVVDAFSSDSIPAHLLTTECARIYRKHMAQGATLLIHISNRALDLEPVVHGLAQSIRYSARRADSPEDRTQGVYSATWMVLEDKPYAQAPRRVLRWTDDFASLWSVMK
ncbi:MAG: fused MFS/spermidine synthase [Bryobacteraceae bacterium]